MVNKKNIYTRFCGRTHIDQLNDKYIGVRVIGDIHGQYDEFETVVLDAMSKGFFPIQLGDLVDRGDMSYECLTSALYMKEQDLGLFIAGNHEHRHYAYMTNPNSIVKPHYFDTIRQLKNFTDKELFLFLEFMQQENYSISYLNFLFTHASYTPEHCKDVLTKKEMKRLKQHSLYGVHLDEVKKNPKKQFEWIESVPKEKIVVVGHNTLNMEKITCIVGNNHGTVFFIDIGCERKTPPKVAFLDILCNGEITPNVEIRELSIEELYGLS